MRLFLTAAVAVVAFLAAPAPAHAEWVWPLRGPVVTTYRNGDDPYAGGQHRGIDIAGPVGAPVVAAAGGEVRFAGTAGSSGLTVSVRTADGFDTSYLHLSSASVRAGEVVSSGDALGAVGTTGSRSTSEPHLHFGVREAGARHAYLNPLDFLPPPAPATPDAPHPAPSPVPVPTPAAPAPAPAGEPAGRRLPLGDPAPHRVPFGARSPRSVPAGERAPGRVPVGESGPRRAPVGEGAPRPAPASDRAPRGVPDGRRAPGRVPVDERAPRPDPTRDHAPRGVPLSEGAPLENPAGGRAPRGELGVGAPREPKGALASSPGNAAAGPDVGWILACVGLLAAAALLGLTDGGRAASQKGRGHLARLLRPLTGRG
jgi:Peptidase family M23